MLWSFRPLVTGPFPHHFIFLLGLLNIGPSFIKLLSAPLTTLVLRPNGPFNSFLSTSPMPLLPIFSTLCIGVVTIHNSMQPLLMFSS